MDKAKFIGTVSLELIKVPEYKAYWEPYETEDILNEGLVTTPKDYLLTLGSGIYYGSQHTPSSLATTPSYRLPSTSQIYIAGRDVIRWGGNDSPNEIDFDHYLFTPDYSKNIAIVSKAPKSEEHHFSQLPQKMDHIPGNWKPRFEEIFKGDFR